MKEIIEQYGETIYGVIGGGIILLLMIGIIYGPFREYMIQML